jgi:hypothetical protein
MTLLWNEYADAAISQGRQPYMYSAFCRRHRRRAEANPEATMHIEWRAGEWAQADWCGDTMRVLDLDTGELPKAWVFVASLPFSAYIHAEGFYRMDEQACKCQALFSCWATLCHVDMDRLAVLCGPEVERVSAKREDLRHTAPPPHVRSA